MTTTGVPERRFRAPAPSLSPECRLCWRPIDLDRSMLERTEQHVYVRCPHCRGSFPIRHRDVQDLGGA